MKKNNFEGDIKEEISAMKTGGLFKDEKILKRIKNAEIVIGGRTFINMCSNNYLGLSQDKNILKSAEQGLKKYGLGLNSVRFIAGTTELHKELEAEVSRFFHTEDAVLYSSCFDANGGLFEVLLKEGDVVFSDELNHASIIDGIRLCKAERFRFGHNNLGDLESLLKKADKARRRLIVTDGVFSMDGDIALLDRLYLLAKKYNALLMVDDSHGSGTLGRTGRGSIEEKNILGKVDILTSTFGKALGGGGGGFTATSREIASILRQKSRPYLFSNSLMPAIVSAALYALKNFDKEFLARKDKLAENTIYFRTKASDLGFKLGGASCHIVPVMVGDEKKAVKLADLLFGEGVYVRGFTYPVVAKGQARVRIQISAMHTKKQLDSAISALGKAGKVLQII